MPTFTINFTVNFTRAGMPNHPVPKYREDHEDQTDVTVEALHGCFNSTMRIMAFGGEVQIFIHTSGGHCFNWLVVISRADTAPKVIKGPDEYTEGDNIQDAFDAISESGECRSWWEAALPKIKELAKIV